MALMTCPHCGKPMSEKAVSCPHCGYTNPKFDQSMDSMNVLKGLGIIYLIICVLAGLLVLAVLVLAVVALASEM